MSKIKYNLACVEEAAFPCAVFLDKSRESESVMFAAGEE